MQLLIIWVTMFSSMGKRPPWCSPVNQNKSQKRYEVVFHRIMKMRKNGIIMADLETPFGLLTVINGYFPQGESCAW